MITSMVSDMITTKLTLSGTAQKLESPTVAHNQRSGRHHIEIVNSGSTPIYIGGASVTTDDGLPIPPNTGKIIPVSYDADLYVTGTGTAILAEYFM